MFLLHSLFISNGYQTMRQLKKVLLFLCLFLCFHLQAKDTKVRIAENILYVGAADKKIPAGPGTLYIMDRPSKEPVSHQDVVTGVFNGSNVSSASVVFSSGWKFKGSLSYSVEMFSKKPFLSSFKYYLTGVISDPKDTFSYNVENLMIERKTEGDQGSLDSESKVFSSSPYVIRLIINQDSWTATPFIKLAPAVYYEGEQTLGSPSGRGSISLLNSDDILTGDVLEKVTGTFSGNTINNAIVIFSSGWRFNGLMSYEFVTNDSIPYSTETTFTLNGYLTDTVDETISMNNDRIKMVLTPNQIHLLPYSWEQNINVPYDKLSKYENFVKYDIVTTPVIYELKENGTNKQWEISQRSATEHPEFYYASGHVITEYSEGFSLQYPNTNFFEVKNGKVSAILKTFPGCTIHLDENQSTIYYSDGGRYIGTFSINNIQCHSDYTSLSTRIQELMNPNLFIDEVPLMYIDGVYTYPNGKNENWQQGITDYQQNEINGNYDKVSAAVMKAIQEKMAEEGAELERRWQAALPDLRKEYGAKDVDAIYNYRLNRRTNVELFKDLARLGLIDLMGPIYSTNAKNSCHEYVISMRNRETGELQYSLILKFVHPFRSSPDWILDRYSTNF